MMQDSPVAHKNYTVALYIQKEIAKSKLNTYILACTRATSSGTLKIYTVSYVAVVYM